MTQWNHGFRRGQRVSKGVVVTACLRHIEAGGVDDPEGKRRRVEQIAALPGEILQFAPTQGWGASPLNPNAWLAVRGPVTGRSSLDEFGARDRGPDSTPFGAMDAEMEGWS
jgi:hypothetical protein